LQTGLPIANYRLPISILLRKIELPIFINGFVFLAGQKKQRRDLRQQINI
jgi:membrane-anchored glycerophosphoryl diester phosphodiesterase (GDPDase)